MSEADQPPARRFVVQERDEEYARSGCALGMGISAVMIVFSFGWIFALFADGFSFDFSSIFGSVVSLAVGTLGVMTFIVSVSNRLANKRLGEVDYELVESGSEGLGASVAFTAKTKLELTDIRLQVTGSRSFEAEFDSTKTEHDVFFLEEFALEGARTVQRGERVSVARFIPIPPDAPFSTDTGPDEIELDEKVRWTSSLVIGIDGWPDHGESRDFKVTDPETARLLGAAPLADRAYVFDKADFVRPEPDEPEVVEEEESVDPAGLW